MSTLSSPTGLFGPAVSLMQGLRLPTKLALVGLLVAAPLVGLTGLIVAEQNVQLATARDERDGAQAVRALLEVAVLTQKHRGQTNMVLSGNAAAKDQLPATRAAWTAALGRVDTALALRPQWGLGPQWQQVRTAIAPLADGRHGSDRAQVFQQHTAQVESLRRLVLTVGESAELLFDPKPVTYFLAETQVDRLLPWIETAALLRGQGAGLLARGEAQDEEMATLLARIGMLEGQLTSVQDKVDALQRHGEPAHPRWADAVAQTRSFVALARTNFAGGQVRGAPADYFQAGTRAIEAIVAYEQASGERLQTLLEERDQTLTRQRNASLGLTLAGLLGLLYIGAAFYRSTMLALRRVEAAARAGAQGDLTVKARVPGSDEFADMGREIDRMTEQLTGLVTGIRHHADQVAATGDQMAHDSHELSQRTNEQAASVEQSSATLTEVAQNVRINGEQVQQVTVLFGQVRHSVEKGTERMQAAVQTMEGIEAASRRVTDIVSVIDGIAFQTNILALNAAVEAARAGESGRGFAVVASEVRNLAGRCSQAAGEIRTLIAASTGQVEIGVGQIHGARDSLAQLLSQADEVNQAMDALSTSTREQTLGVDQVNDGVRMIGEMTLGNAHSVEMAATLAEALRGRARELQELVAAIRVPSDAAPAGVPAGSTAAAALPERSAAWA